MCRAAGMAISPSHTYLAHRALIWFMACALQGGGGNGTGVVSGGGPGRRRGGGAEDNPEVAAYLEKCAVMVHLLELTACSD
jgi:hypothetical protein